MTLEELQAELNELPSQDSDYLVGFLMEQLVWAINELEEKSNEET
tara:strand:+ start:97 stop:231 length:135 start_codon:yes stop_codon:yes gene_type:complete